MANEFKSKFPVNDRKLLNSILENEKKQREFVIGYTNIIRLLNHLTTFEDFVNNITNLDPITEAEHQNYRSYYITFSERVRKERQVGKENIINDIEFEMELIKRININVCYILQLIKEMKLKNISDKTIETQVMECVDSTIQLRSKKLLIREFIEMFNSGLDTDENWNEFVSRKKEEYLDRLVLENKLNRERTEKFIQKCFKQGFIDTDRDSRDITDLPEVKINLLMGDDFIKKQKSIISESIKEYFETFYNI